MTQAPRTFSGVPPIGAFIGALGVAMVVASGVVLRYVWEGRSTALDVWWYELVAGHRIAPVEAAARFLNTFGGTLSITVVTTITVGVLLIFRRWRESLTVALTVALASGLSTVLKIVIARHRPPDGVLDVGSNSFPSGHTTTAVALAVAIALAFPHIWTWVLATAWAAIMALSRTYLLVHWPTDVLAGAILGAATALIVSAGVTALARHPPSVSTRPISESEP